MYDVIIIGAGPAGITAGLYTQRGNLKTLIIHNGKTPLENANKIENYYGFENGITGKELYFQGIRQAQNIGIDVKNEEVINNEELCIKNQVPQAGTVINAKSSIMVEM